MITLRKHISSIYFFKVTFLLLLLLVFFPAFSQDVEALVKAKPVTVSGGLSTDHIYYNADGIASRRNSPYQYYITGNVNFTFFGELSVPMSFSYSNQKFSYTEPFNQQQFNQFGMSPRYKWVTVHAGWRNMTFSPYSLNGHTFLGGGLELKPGNFTISGMYGRLLKGVDFDTTETGSANQAAYERYGMGFNVQYAHKGSSYGLAFFRSKDEPNSVATPLDTIGITPEDNFVWDLTLNQKFTEKLHAKLHYGYSVITKDSRAQSEGNSVNTLGIISENNTTVNYNALKGNITYVLGMANIGLGYERIDPGYRTHGSYFFNNDLENITVDFSSPLFNNKLNLSTSLGTQRNNLDNTKVSTMRRWIGMVNLAWNASEDINVGLSYSNFQTYTNMTSQFLEINSSNPYENLDSLNYVQVTQSINGNMNWILAKNDNNQQNFSTNLSYQQANEEQGGEKLNTGTKFYNGNINYLYTVVPVGLTFTLAVNGNWNTGLNMDTKTYGPTVGLAKNFFEKVWKSSLTYSWNTTLSNNETTGYVSNIRWNNNIALKKKHSILLSLVYLDRTRFSAANGNTSFSEFTGRFGYSYRF